MQLVQPIYTNTFELLHSECLLHFDITLEEKINSGMDFIESHSFANESTMNIVDDKCPGIL